MRWSNFVKMQGTCIVEKKEFGNYTQFGLNAGTYVVM